MKKNEIYWLNLYKDGKIEIDFDNGIVYSFLSGSKKEIGNHRDGWYKSSSAGPSRKERYNILLHRLIWIVANGDIPPKIEINHINGNKRDNRLENLELSTKSENALHSRRVLGNKGGVLCGEKHGMAKLNWDKVNEIRKSYECEGARIYELAKKFNVNWCTIRDIVCYRHWITKENINNG